MQTADPTVVVLYADHQPTLHLGGAEIRFATADTLTEAMPGAEVLLVWDFFSGALREAWPAVDTLRWVHVASAGVDTLLFDELVDSAVVVTNSRGVFDRPIAEFVLASVLAFAKDVPESLRLQGQRRWRHRETEQVCGARAIVVGTGSIGREIARLLRVVGVQVEGVGRVARPDDPDFGVVHASADLASVVGQVDYLVLAAPLTEVTRGMVDAKVLAQMPPRARLINIGRGELVVTADLVDALRRGAIAGAALDVFDTEPLPADHPLWTMESVLVTPHMSGDAVGWRDRLAEMFIDNYRRYVAGEPLHNVVDKQRGYVPG